jgi:predicted nucleic acid-binding protein
MPRYFLDTWFFIARSDPADSHRRQALRLDAHVRHAPQITHDAVLTEFLAFFSGFGTAVRLRAAASVRDAVRQMKVVPGSRQLFIDALHMYEQRADKGYSLVDCMSMVVMNEHGVTHVLTNDHHFRQEGFIVLSDSP